MPTIIKSDKNACKAKRRGIATPVKYLSFTTQRTRLQNAQTVTHKRNPASVVPIGWPRSLSYRTARKICSFFGVKVYSCLVNPARSADLPTSFVDVTNFLLIAQPLLITAPHRRPALPFYVCCSRYGFIPRRSCRYDYFLWPH